MTCNLSRYAVVLILIMPSSVTNGQVRKVREYERRFQLSLFPGISTNGVSSGSYFNQFSINLFGGFSAGNRVFEAGIITNTNFKSVTGIQLAGLANVIGTNAFINLTLSEERALIHDGFEANNKGIQVAGLLNYVRDHAASLQITGGLNVVGGDFKGVQIAGIGNAAGGTAVGFMLAGLYNVAVESVGGFQVSLLFNHTDAQLSGMQVALINKAASIKGKKSTPPTRARGLQIGLVNFSKAMDGVQIGLINFGGAMRGKQIGLINFFERYGSKENTRMGTPIGLLNYGSLGSTYRLVYDELFPATFEYTTGNCLNCSWVMGSEMPYHDRNKIYNQNALIVGFDPARDTWGFGYGFRKILYNKFVVRPHPNNEKRMIAYGVKFIHLNRALKLDRTFNVVNRLHLDYGKRFGSGHYWFVGVSVNYFLYEPEENKDPYKVQSMKIASGKVQEWSSSFWPGYTFGVQL